MCERIYVGHVFPCGKTCPTQEVRQMVSRRDSNRGGAEWLVRLTPRDCQVNSLWDVGFGSSSLFFGDRHMVEISGNIVRCGIE